MKKLFIVLIAVSLLYDVCVSQDFWQETFNFGSSTGPFDFVQDSDGRIYAEYHSSITLLRSTNEGLTWTALDSYLPAVPIYEHCTYSYFCKNDILFTHIHSGSYSGYINIGHGIYRSNDHGTTWEKVVEGLGADTNIVEMYLAPNGNILAYHEYYGDGKIYTSTDNGNSWTLTYNLGNSKDAIWVNPANEILLSYGANLLYKSTDNGITWNYVNNSFTYAIKDEMLKISDGALINNTSLSAGTDIWYNNYKSNDNGYTWVDCADNDLDSIRIITQCITAGDTIYCGTFENEITKYIYFSVDEAETWDTVDLSGINYINSIYEITITKSGYLLASVYFDGIYRSVEKVSSPSSGIQDNNDIGNLSIYPNPASDFITIEGVNIQRVEVIDMTGKKVAVEDYSDVSVAKINTLSLPNGVYCLRVSTNEGWGIKRVIINK